MCIFIRRVIMYIGQRKLCGLSYAYTQHLLCLFLKMHTNNSHIRLHKHNIIYKNIIYIRKLCITKCTYTNVYVYYPMCNFPAHSLWKVINFQLFFEMYLSFERFRRYICGRREFFDGVDFGSNLCSTCSCLCLQKYMFICMQIYVRISIRMDIHV